MYAAKLRFYTLPGAPGRYVWRKEWREADAEAGEVKVVELKTSCRHITEIVYETRGRLYDYVVRKKHYVINIMPSLPAAAGGRVNTRFVAIKYADSVELADLSLTMSTFHFVHPRFIFMKRRGKKPTRLIRDEERWGELVIKVVQRGVKTREVVEEVELARLRFRYIRQSPPRPELRRGLLALRKDIRRLAKQGLKSVYLEKQFEKLQNLLQPRGGALFRVSGRWAGEDIDAEIWFPSTSSSKTELEFGGQRIRVMKCRDPGLATLLQDARHVTTLRGDAKFQPYGRFGKLNHTILIRQLFKRHLVEGEEPGRRDVSVDVYELDSEHAGGLVRTWIFMPQSGGVDIVVKNRDHRHECLGRLLFHVKHDEALVFTHML